MGSIIVKETSKRIQDARKASGKSVDEITEATGIGRATYYRYESGDQKNMKLDKIQKIADFFGVYAADLVVWEDEKPAPTEGNGLDAELTKMLMRLSQDEVAKVAAFVQGLLAARKE